MDELSVKTYVSYFPAAKLKPGALFQPWAHPATTESANTPAVEPKDLNMIPKKENTAHLSTTQPQQRRLGWNLKTLMRFRRRKLRPTHLAQPKDLDVNPKKENTAHPWSTSDSVKRPGLEGLKILMTFRGRKLQRTHLQAKQQRGLVWNQKTLM